MSKGLRRSKTCWHPLSLQQLTPNQLVGVVNGILSGRLTLVSYMVHRPHDVTTGPAGAGRPAEDS